MRRPRSALLFERSSAYQLLPYVLSKAKVESELGNAASTYSSGFFGGVSDIKDDPKRAAVAAGPSRCLQSLGCDVGSHLAEGALHEQRRGDEQRNSPGAPCVDHPSFPSS